MVLIFRSVNNIVIAAAKTGNDNSNKIAVTKTDQQYKGNASQDKPLHLIKEIVTIKFIAPPIDEIPAKCKENIAASTAGPECAQALAKGGYTVQPVPAPTSKTLDNNNNLNEGTKSQKLKLFKRANAISGAPINKGTNQLPKPPIKIGITKKKIIVNA